MRHLLTGLLVGMLALTGVTAHAQAPQEPPFCFTTRLDDKVAPGRVVKADKIIAGEGGYHIAWHLLSDPSVTGTHPAGFGWPKTFECPNAVTPVPATVTPTPTATQVTQEVGIANVVEVRPTVIPTAPEVEEPPEVPKRDWGKWIREPIRLIPLLVIVMGIPLLLALIYLDQRSRQPQIVEVQPRPTSQSRPQRPEPVIVPTEEQAEPELEPAEAEEPDPEDLLIERLFALEDVLVENQLVDEDKLPRVGEILAEHARRGTQVTSDSISSGVGISANAAKNVLFHLKRSRTRLVDDDGFVVTPRLFLDVYKKMRRTAA